MSIIQRNNVKTTGTGTRTLLFAHGFGCDQNMWRYVAPQFQNDFRVVTFDHVGAVGALIFPPMIFRNTRRLRAMPPTSPKSGGNWGLKTVFSLAIPSVL
jgi:pimeloyl-ACP methyl ester carboxylesterase